jgi:lipopolysaccharide transport system ATP-binding protein
MYTRLAFAVATAVDPDILITDEVLAVGDEAFQRKCMERIYRFRQLGKTIIFVSHALEIVRTLCDQAVWLDHGQARAVGPAGQVIDAYLAEVNRQEHERLAQQSGTVEVAEENLFRRGSREIEIVDVELLDAAGRAQSVFQTHQPVTIRIHYRARQPVVRPVFGIGLYHENGIWLTGPNTRFDSLEIPSVDGAGAVDYTIADLPLLTGRYLLSVAVYDDTLLHPYDHHDRLYRLVVQSEGLRERFGMLSFSGRWAWHDTQVDADLVQPLTEKQ